MRLARLLAVALVTIFPLRALGTDAPHVFEGCKDCHVGHTSPGASLTKRDGNFTLCNSCHTDTLSPFKFPWTLAMQATPGSGGYSHRWDANATNATLGASPPLNVAMLSRLDNGNLQCSTCHDQHLSDAFATTGRGSPHIQTPYKSFPAGGSGTVTFTSAPSGFAAKSYLLQFTTGGAVGTAVFRVSNDNKISWVQTGVLTAASVTLTDGVVLAFGGTNFVATEEYKFYVSYPFLRADNTDGSMCVDCHRERNMTYQNVEGSNLTHAGTNQPIVLGTTVFSHPVGQALNANSRGYDRASTAILDADGSLQTTGDVNKTNDLVVGATGLVSCLTCHYPHNADSNSLSVDAR